MDIDKMNPVIPQQKCLVPQGLAIPIHSHISQQYQKLCDKADAAWEAYYPHIAENPNSAYAIWDDTYVTLDTAWRQAEQVAAAQIQDVQAWERAVWGRAQTPVRPLWEKAIVQVRATHMPPAQKSVWEERLPWVFAQEID